MQALLTAVVIGYAATGPGFGVGLFCILPRPLHIANPRWTAVMLASTLPWLVLLLGGVIAMCVAGGTPSAESAALGAASAPASWLPLLLPSNALTFNLGLYWGDHAAAPR